MFGVYGISTIVGYLMANPDFIYVFNIQWKRNGGIGNQQKNRNHPDFSMAKIVYITQKTLGELRSLSVSHIFVKDHKLRLVRKKTKGVKLLL